MQASNRRFLMVFGAALLLMLIAAGGVAWSIHRAGMLEVDVRATGPGGCDVTGIRIPAALGHLALAFAPDEAFCCCDAEVGRWCPLIKTACKELSACPDFTLVEVISRHECVKIRKEGGSLLILVEDHNERVRVRVPMGIAEAFARKIGKS